MTQEQKNLAIIIIVAGLVIGGILYFKNKEKVNEDTIESPAILSTEEEGQSWDMAEEISGQNPAAAASADVLNNDRFNASMKNAHIAFGKREYKQAKSYYNLALKYKNEDTAHYGLFMVYSVQGNWVRAQEALDAAIKINPHFADYWRSKISLMDERTNASYEDLKKVYSEGLLKVDPGTKINLITFFAGVAESNGRGDQAMIIWEYAQKVFPDNKFIYQDEIDRLRGKI